MSVHFERGFIYSMKDERENESEEDKSEKEDIVIAEDSQEFDVDFEPIE